MRAGTGCGMLVKSITSATDIPCANVGCILGTMWPRSRRAAMCAWGAGESDRELEKEKKDE